MKGKLIITPKEAQKYESSLGEKSTFPRLSKEMLYTKVADEIRKYIERNDLQCGDKLPAERALASSLGISRASVREGLRILEHKGIITVKTGVGAFVSESVSGPSMFINIVRINFLEMLEIKVALEAVALRQIISSLTVEQLDTLEEIANRMLILYKTGTYDEQLDILFHKTLVDCTPNRSLAGMIHELIDLFTQYWAEIATDPANMIHVARLYETLPMHSELVRALRSGDIGEALSIHDAIYRIDISVINSLNQ